MVGAAQQGGSAHRHPLSTRVALNLRRLSQGHAPKVLEMDSPDKPGRRRSDAADSRGDSVPSCGANPSPDGTPSNAIGFKHVPMPPLLDRLPAPGGLESSPTRPRRLQFRLSYLLYLITLFALGFALVRLVISVRGGWLMNTAGTLYLLALVIYFGVRLPILFRRWRSGARQMEAKRQELTAFAAQRMDQYQHSHHANPISPNPMSPNPMSRDKP